MFFLYLLRYLSNRNGMQVKYTCLQNNAHDKNGNAVMDATCFTCFYVNSSTIILGAVCMTCSLCLSFSFFSTIDTPISPKSSVEEFIKSIVTHIPEQNFKIIRNVGIFSNRTKGEKLPLARGVLKQPRPTMKDKLTYRKMYYKAFGICALPCNLCEVCTIDTNCQHPEKARPTFQACGMDVPQIMAKLGWTNGKTITPCTDSHPMGMVLIH